MTNGIASIVIVKKTGRLNSLAYTYDDEGKSKTCETLSGNGQYYYGGFSLGNGVFEYSLATDPASNGGNLADVKLVSSTETNGVMEIHFSMLRGSPGFYSTATMTHRKQDQRFEVGAWGVVTRVPPAFNWVSADERRNWFIGVPTKKGAKVPDSPHEVTVCLDGTEAGKYEDKFIYAQDHSDLRAWGWSSVGPGGLNVGRWMMTTMEFSNGGPLKRDVSVYPYSELNNSILTGEVGMGSDGYMDDGEVWTKTCGPWFTYMNHVPASVTNAKQAAQQLYQDALAQADAEAKAWPYAWFKNEHFVPASGRGVVKGKFVIRDSGNPNASAGGLWVGLQQQPQTYKGFYDFQKWSKTYQFWVKTEADGSFTIPYVIAGDNYLLWAFGPGAAGTFLSHKLAGGNPPFECNLPAQPFMVAVKAGETKQLGTITWSPARFGATVFELGIPNRKADEFRHGDDYWNPGTPPKLGFPTPVWGGQMEFPLDFPDGMNYVVGKSQWTKDWNYVLPAAAGPTGEYQPCTGTISFDLEKVPQGAAASLYLALAGNDGDKVVVSVNGTNLDEAVGASGLPNKLLASGFSPAYSDTSSIHYSDHGPFCDERISFPSDLLRPGKNTISLTMASTKLVSFMMIDYLRLELPGYVPPAPVDVAAYAGDGRVLITWPVVPGATSYDILRSANRDTGYVPISTGNVAQICGSGASRATFIDTAALNGSQYYYAVQSVNPGGHSVNSRAGVAVTPAAGISASVPPPPPMKLAVASTAHHKVTLSWDASLQANYYSVWRTTLHEDGIGGTYPLRTTLIEDMSIGTSYTDHSPTDGRIYSYYVTAMNAAGTSGPSSGVTAVPLPEPVATAPASVTGTWKKTRNGDAIVLHWSPVPGATGYVLYRSTGAGASFKWPENFLTALVETTYTDEGNTAKDAKIKGLDHSLDYNYQVTAVNAASVSPSTEVRVPAQPLGASR